MLKGNNYKWIVAIEKKLQPLDKKFLLICGNDDYFEIDPIINSSEFIINLDNVIYSLMDTYEILGEASANLTPFNCPRDIEDSILLNKLETKIKDIKNLDLAIFVIHAPPYNSGLDNAPKLDKDLKPILFIGHEQTEAVGSQSVRNIIEKYQPLVTLHGHIHESPGAISIGRTMCFNAGSEYSKGILNAYLIILEEKKISDFYYLKI